MMACAGLGGESLPTALAALVRGGPPRSGEWKQARRAGLPGLQGGPGSGGGGAATARELAAKVVEMSDAVVALAELGGRGVTLLLFDVSPEGDWSDRGQIPGCVAAELVA